MWPSTSLVTFFEFPNYAIRHSNWKSHLFVQQSSILAIATVFSSSCHYFDSRTADRNASQLIIHRFYRTFVTSHIPIIVATTRNVIIISWFGRKHEQPYAVGRCHSTSCTRSRCWNTRWSAPAFFQWGQFPRIFDGDTRWSVICLRRCGVRHSRVGTSGSVTSREWWWDQYCIVQHECKGRYDKQWNRRKMKIISRRRSFHNGRIS